MRTPRSDILQPAINGRVSCFRPTVGSESRLHDRMIVEWSDVIRVITPNTLMTTVSHQRIVRPTVGNKRIRI